MRSAIREKARTAFWFLKRPIYWGQFMRLIRRVVIGDDNYRRSESQARCADERISLHQFFEQLGLELCSFDDQQYEISRFAYTKFSALRQDLGGGANMDLLYNLALMKSCVNVLETGVAYGWSTLAILTALNKKKDGQLVSIDMPYPKMNNEEIVGAVVPNNLKNRWALFREADITGIARGIERLGKIDLCHYDSDKSYQGRMWAYPKLWKALNSGGFLVSDDIQDNTGFFEFCESINQVPDVIGYDSKYLGVLLKP